MDDEVHAHDRVGHTPGESTSAVRLGPCPAKGGGSWVPAPKYGWTWASVVPLATGVMYTNQADVMGAHPVSPQGNL